jgi:hypothetical protein
MTLYLLKVHLQTFLSIPVTQKCQILSCDTLVALSDICFTNLQIVYRLISVEEPAKRIDGKEENQLDTTVTVY